MDSIISVPDIIQMAQPLIKEDVTGKDGSKTKVNQIGDQFYRFIRNVIIFLLGFGSPLNRWLKPSDRFRILLKKHNYFWFTYRILLCLSFVICLALNIWSLIHLCLWSNKGLIDLSAQLAQFIWSLSAVLSLNSSYDNRNSDLMVNTCLDISHILKDDSSKDLKQDPQPYKVPESQESTFMEETCNLGPKSSLETLLRFVATICWTPFGYIYDKINFNLEKKLWIKLFLLPIVFSLCFTFALIMNFNDLSLDKWLNLLTYMNKLFVLLNILLYVNFCLVFRDNIRLLNQYIRTITTKSLELEILSSKQLFYVCKWYDSIYKNVQEFNKTFKYTILAFYVSILYELAYNTFVVISIWNNHSNDQLVNELFNLVWIVISVLLSAIVIYFTNDCSTDVYKESKASKKLFRTYANPHNNNVIIDPEFNANLLRVNVVIMEPIKIRQFGFKSITITTIVMPIITLVMRYSPEAIYYLLHIFATNRQILSEQTANKSI